MAAGTGEKPDQQGLKREETGSLLGPFRGFSRSRISADGRKEKGDRGGQRWEGRGEIHFFSCSQAGERRRLQKI